jgi:hypothetical protein
MARIAPKDLSDAIAAAQPGDHLELDSGEHVGQVVIDRPLVIEGRGASTWLGNRTGPVLIIRCQGVELRDLQIEITGDLEQPAIFAEGNCEPVLKNVAIRRGELHVEGPLLRFAPPPPIRLRDLASTETVEAAEPATAAATTPATVAMTPRTATSLSLSPPPPPPPPSSPVAMRQPPVAVARTRAEAAQVAATAAPAPKPATPSKPATPALPRSWFAAAAIGAVALGGLVLYAVSGSASRSAATSSATTGRVATAAEQAIGKAGSVASAVDPSTGRSSEPSVAPSPPSPSPADAPPPPAELRLTSNLRTNIEVVGWSEDEERFLVEITYGRDSSLPAPWRVRALVDAPSERVLQWQDLSDPPARVVSGEDEQPPWSKTQEAIPVENFKSGRAIAPSQLEVRWCGNRKSPRFPIAARPLESAPDQQLELAWASRGKSLAPAQCRAGDFGQVLLQVKGTPWRLMRLLAWKGDTSAMRVYSSPSGRRAVVVALFSLGGKRVARFYSRLLGPQIHVVSSNPELRDEAMRKMRAMGTPGLFMSEDARAPIAAPSRILVRAGDEEALRVAQSLQEKLGGELHLAEIEKISISHPPPRFDLSYLWGDVLIVLK